MGRCKVRQRHHTPRWRGWKLKLILSVFKIVPTPATRAEFHADPIYQELMTPTDFCYPACILPAFYVVPSPAAGGIRALL